MLRFAALFLLALSAAFAGSFTVDAPIINWKLPLFTNEGYRWMNVAGAEARMQDARHVLLTDMNLTLFTGDATNKVDSIMLSPVARIDLDDNLVSGERSVRLVRDDLEVTGSDWTYDHLHKKVTIKKDARVVFRTELPAFFSQ